MKGFTLLESLIAIFLVAVGVAGAFTLVNQTVSAGNSLTSRITADYLVQEGMEIVRSIRDTNLINGLNWSDGLENCGSGCEADYTYNSLPPFTAPGQKFKIENGFYKYSAGGIETNFWRKISIDTTSPVKLKVLVQVFWSERGQTNETSAEGFLYINE